MESAQAITQNITQATKGAKKASVQAMAVARAHTGPELRREAIKYGINVR